MMTREFRLGFSMRGSKYKLFPWVITGIWFLLCTLIFTSWLWSYKRPMVGTLRLPFNSVSISQPPMVVGVINGKVLISFGTNQHHGSAIKIDNFVAFVEYDK